MPGYAWSIVRPSYELLGCVEAPSLTAAVQKVARRHTIPVCSWVHEAHELRGLSPLGRVSVRIAEIFPPERKRSRKRAPRAAAAHSSARPLVALRDARERPPKEF